MNTLRHSAEEYLAMRRNLGFKMKRSGPRLLEFVSFMEQQRASHITSALALAWAKQPEEAQPDSWAQRLRRTARIRLPRSPREAARRERSQP
jgi:integrase/recombinase XerD